MSGLTFHRSTKYKETISFYREKIGMSIWLEQGGCTILQKGNFLLGFCDRDEADTEGMITFFFETKEEVDLYYRKFKESAAAPPKITEQYRIYHFFTKDPEGRNVEFQTFLHPVESHMTGSMLLKSRRSIRQFSDALLPEATLRNIFEECRYVPTSCNSQAYYFKVIRDREILEKLSAIRGSSSKPIKMAPMAVIAYSDPAGTGRPEQDGAIASTYFVLAAAQHGAGTCWIGGMDREDVKELTGIGKNMHIAMVTPLGWPEERKALPERRMVNEFVEGLN
ncbi:nitroreductase family protein [Spirochaeta isovalerica]|uniref:Nitroreductase/predicted lactoylglutathione lyase n=1 Tax=Spirochaeta isovalerica TaxID=150 RepID=A0A841RFW3_9SPIO|nr:nitroreductase family protein [Spirochaeta isovalerica]MBB6482107.1 nitroreductase/predicted lactoylglutathione lyase [Spirochaeta isovalerica]